jgi:hypothetical protein
MNKTIEEIMTLFDIPSSEKDSNDYSSTAEDENKGKPSFDELLNDIGDSLVEGKDSPVLPIKSKETENEKQDQTEDKTIVRPAIQPEKKVDLPKVDNPKTEEKKTMSAEELIKSSINVTDDEEDSNVNVDDIFANNGSEKKEEIVDIKKVKDSEVKVTVEGEKIPDETKPIVASPEIKKTTAVEETVVKTKVRDILNCVNGQIQWLLTSPGEKYLYFYEDKKETINNLLLDGYIPFDKYKKELRESHIDLDVPSHDLGELSDKMIDIQRLKERIFEISMHVNSQYYKFKRFMELLRGQLSRVDSETNSLKREGVNFQHLRDMELYFTDVEYLHNQITLIWKNLESAWETLNRKVTICLADKNSPERIVYAPKHEAAPIVPQNELRSVTKPETQASSPLLGVDDPFADFDSLESAAEEKQTKSGSKTIDW